ncbi:MAG: hypothetical protein V3U84_10005, partial [Thiotrichaceae bacterium]
LSNFLSLHDKYCAAEYASAEHLTSALQDDPEFNESEVYDGIFEKSISSISYAVSPEESGCTTDLKIRASSKVKPFFGFEDINTALLSKGYKVTGKREVRTEIGLDNRELRVVEQHYESNNTLSTLVFPLENEDQYYMTLFVEKFEMQGASLKVTSPAALVEI